MDKDTSSHVGVTFTPAQRQLIEALDTEEAQAVRDRFIARSLKAIQDFNEGEASGENEPIKQLLEEGKIAEAQKIILNRLMAK